MSTPRVLIIAAVLCLLAATPPAALDLADLPDDDALARGLWERHPDLTEARARMRVEEAGVVRARMLPNPTLDVGADSLAVGPRGPEIEPRAPTANYGAALSELFEIGKRGPRLRAASRALEASRHEAGDVLRRSFFELVSRLGDVAAAELRVEVLQQLAADASELTELMRLRAQKGDVAGLEVDRAYLEEHAVLAALEAERAQLGSALTECSRAASARCLPFAAPDRANAFLERWLGAAAPNETEPESRPDIAALQAREQSARANAELARAHAIPDPTLSVGYVHDRLAGNPRHALSAAVSIPLPLFDRGQADAAAAFAEADAASVTRRTLLERSRDELDRLAERAAAVNVRRARLQDRTLPLARDVADRMQRALLQGGAGLQEVLLARRTLGELLAEAVDLDLSAFELAVERARLAAGAPFALPN